MRLQWSVYICNWGFLIHQRGTTNAVQDAFWHHTHSHTTQGLSPYFFLGLHPNLQPCGKWLCLLLGSGNHWVKAMHIFFPAAAFLKAELGIFLPIQTHFEIICQKKEREISPRQLPLKTECIWSTYTLEILLFKSDLIFLKWDFSICNIMAKAMPILLGKGPIFQIKYPSQVMLKSKKLCKHKYKHYSWTHCALQEFSKYNVFSCSSFIFT